MANPYIKSSWSKPDSSFEMPLRPQTMQDFIGQEKIKEQLKISISAAKSRNEPLGHYLFCGPPGIGKTTFAYVVAKEMESNIVITSGPVLEKPADLAGILTNLQPKDILFLDEMHRLPNNIEEYLYPAMEDFRLDLLIDSGPSARSVQIKLSPFTLIGATTRVGLLSSPMRSRFIHHTRLDYYDTKALSKIVERSASLMNISINMEAASAIALRSRGTPRIANNLLRWIRDFIYTKKQNNIDLSMVHDALKMVSIDHLGLNDMDKEILSVIIDHYKGGPVGIQSIAAAIGEEASTLEEVYEPFLIKKGFIKRTPRGREATELAYEHIGRKCPKKSLDGERT